MKAMDLAHIGIVADDFEGTLRHLSQVFGYEWSAEVGGPVPVELPTGTRAVDLRFVFSRSEPRLEVIRPVPGTPWEPVAASGVHHLGYWSDDLAKDAAALEARGMVRQAAGTSEDGTLVWTYHGGLHGPRIEMTSVAYRPSTEALWA